MSNDLTESPRSDSFWHRLRLLFGQREYWHGIVYARMDDRGHIIIAGNTVAVPEAVWEEVRPGDLLRREGIFFVIKKLR